MKGVGFRDHVAKCIESSNLFNTAHQNCKTLRRAYGRSSKFECCCCALCREDRCDHEVLASWGDPLASLIANHARPRDWMHLLVLDTSDATLSEVN